MKKTATVLLIAAFCLMLCACNGGKSKTETNQSATASAEHTTVAAEHTTASEEHTTVAAATKATEETHPQNDEPSDLTVEQAGDLQMTIGNTSVSVAWEDNEAVEALKELCREQPLTISMSMYGGFEQVGSIGTALPQNDAQTTTSAGDIVLYSGDQMVVFYGSNSWAYTRLGHITDKSDGEMADLLSNGDTVITITMT